jgi:putative transposase
VCNFCTVIAPKAATSTIASHKLNAFISPRANAYAERFVLTARTEATDRMLILGERHLGRTLDEYAQHYNGRRPHRSLDLQPPRSDRPTVDLTHQRIKRRPILRGLITEYERAA